MKTTYTQERFTGERALFFARDLSLTDCTFLDGESPLKEGKDLELTGCLFRWKYPLWYCENVAAENCTWFENARAGVWYTNNIRVTDSLIDAPKNFRRCRGVALKNVSFSNAAETFWSCEDVTMENVTARGDYFGMNSRGLAIDGLTLYGNYGFDGAKDLTIRNSKLLTKDAFWNCENVTAENSFISGEYLAWNAKNVTFRNCVIESLQGLCYIENLTMRDCRLLNTTLAFEYSTVDAEIKGKIDSVMNPLGGRIAAGAVDELILEPARVDPEKTEIICSDAEDDA